jgi:hypothetical protein
MRRPPPGLLGSQPMPRSSASPSRCRVRSVAARSAATIRACPMAIAPPTNELVPNAPPTNELVPNAQPMNELVTVEVTDEDALSALQSFAGDWETAAPPKPKRAPPKGEANENDDDLEQHRRSTRAVARGGPRQQRDAHEPGRVLQRN